MPIVDFTAPVSHTWTELFPPVIIHILRVIQQTLGIMLLDFPSRASWPMLSALYVVPYLGSRKHWEDGLLIPRGVGLMAYQYSSPGSDAGAGLHVKVFRGSWPDLVPGWTDWLSGLHTCPHPTPVYPQAGTQALWHLAYVMSQPGTPRHVCPLSFPRPAAQSLSTTNVCKTGQTSLLTPLNIPHSL